MNNVAAIVTAFGTLLTVIFSFVLRLQVIQAKRSVENGQKIDENTAVTKAAAKQIDEVHAATNVLTASASGTYKTLTGP